MINNQDVHGRAKEVIHINETAAKRDATESVARDRQPKKVVYGYGVASFYGGCNSSVCDDFDGKQMANGKPFDMEKVSVAHRTLPLGKEVLVTNIKNGKNIVAVVTDRGPYAKKNGKYSHAIDLSRKAFEKIGSVEEGLASVRIEVFI